MANPSEFHPQPPRIDPWPSEKPLFVCVVLASLMIWFFLAITIIGFFYVGIIALVVLLGHIVMIAHVRGNSVRLGPDQFPDLYTSVERIAKSMGMAKVPEAYLMQQGGALNAFATKLFRSEIIILYSDLIEACGENTQARDMIVAHELAHLKEGHLRWHWFLLPGYMMPFLGMALSRAREYTCDRYGYAYAGRGRNALTGLAILAAGAERGPQVNLQAMAHQVNDLNTGTMAIGQWLSTHPPLSKRLIALEPGLAPPNNYTQKGTLMGLGILGGGYMVVTVFSLIVSLGFGFLVSQIERKSKHTYEQEESYENPAPDQPTSDTPETGVRIEERRRWESFTANLGDGVSISLSAPFLWKIDPDLKKDADLKISNRLAQAHITVASRKKTDLPVVGLFSYSESTRDNLTRSLDNLQVSESAVVTMGDLAGLQYEIRGKDSSGNRIIYLHTVVETLTRFYEIVAWTQEPLYEENGPELKEMVKSFREDARSATLGN